ncbi:hypothetical protein BD560DRAFT_403448 [Blakeslea trispora]|nr:hypothetical protein BD560DRAFT_403448 [Blakeslea trispora]
MSCVWALLSVGPLNFIYASHYQEKLHGLSLWDFMHPEEISFAKRDLSSFISSNKLSGSVTRCRLRDFTTNSNLYSPWLVTDIVMYVATKDLVLVFLHPIDQDTCFYRESQVCLTDLKEALNRNLNQNLPSPSLSTSSSLSSSSEHPPHHSLYPVHDFLSQHPRQCFSIVDAVTKSTLFAWPGDGSEMPSLADVSISAGMKYSCFRCIQPCSRPNSAGDRTERLVIEHGPIAFLLAKIDLNTTSIPTIDHQVAPLVQKQHHALYPSMQHRQHHLRNCCQSCGTDSSPEWRRGPTGHKTLCNACGLRYSRSVARQGKKMAAERRRKQQHSLFQSQNTPHHHQHHYVYHPYNNKSSFISQI